MILYNSLDRPSASEGSLKTCHTFWWHFRIPEQENSKRSSKRKTLPSKKQGSGWHLLSVTGREKKMKIVFSNKSAEQKGIQNLTCTPQVFMDEGKIIFWCLQEFRVCIYESYLIDGRLHLEKQNRHEKKMHENVKEKAIKIFSCLFLNRAMFKKFFLR